MDSRQTMIRASDRDRQVVVDRLRSALEDVRLKMDEYPDRIWLTVVAINVLVWLLVTGTTGHLVYPWPVWVAGPYGAVLFAVSAGLRWCRPSRQPTAPPVPLGG